MTNSDEMLTRYLFGELSEAEQAQLEERYFTDPQTFAQLTQLETELIDNYTCGRLSPRVRERFERAYLSDPNRRARLRFSEALTTKLEQIHAARATEHANARAASWWQRFATLLTGGQRALAFVMALALLLCASVSGWLFIQRQDRQQDLARAREAQSMQAERERATQQQLANEQTRTQELTAELERARTEALARPTPPASERTTPIVASLVLLASDVRGVNTAAPPKLVMPQGAQEVRLQLKLKDNDYQSYQLMLQPVGGRELFKRQHVKPKPNRSGVSFIIALPAAKFSTGDYILTLKGMTTSGDLEDVSQSVFHVEKK